MSIEDNFSKLLGKVAELEKELARLKSVTIPSLNYIALIEGKNANAGAVASFDFQNIPATFSKLIIDLYARGDTAATGVLVNMTFNGAGGVAYYGVRYNIRLTTGLTITEQLGTANIVIGSMAAATSTASAFDALRVEIPQYANTAAHKICLSEFSNNTGDLTTQQIRGSGEGRWKSTAAINQITLTPNAGNFAQYSSAILYGVL